MTCENLPVEIAQAFADVLDQGLIVGAVVFCAGVLLGYFLHFICRFKCGLGDR